MAAASYSITVEQGATFQKQITYKDANGDAVDLTNVTEARAQMRPTIASGTSENFTVEVDDDPTTGIIHWSMDAATTAGLSAPSTQYYDLEIEFADGTVRRLLSGTVTVTPEVTRP